MAFYFLEITAHAWPPARNPTFTMLGTATHTELNATATWGTGRVMVPGGRGRVTDTIQP